MLRIGITGGIGSGKTTVARIFEVLGIPVYYADDAAKRLMNENAALKQQIVQLFGDTIYENGFLNRSKLASLVFKNPEKLSQLNKAVHPVTIKDAEGWMQRNEADKILKIPYAIKEAALIFESGAESHLNFVIGVYAPEALRLNRVMNRDKLSREAVLLRMEKQMDEEEKMGRCHFVITNDEAQLLIPQVEELHKKILNLKSNI